jgi:mRNA-degrading endonuclease toxin of MazEF toxin-antitoxin module
LAKEGGRYLERVLEGGKKVISQRDVVLLSFPFSDLKGSKVRPAIVLSNDRYNRRSEDFVAAPLTSNLKLRDYAISIANDQLEEGRLIVESKVKVDRVFSASQKLVRMKIGRAKAEIHEKITDTLFELLRGSR